MAKTERIIVRVEPDVKAESDKLFRSMGITTSDAIYDSIYLLLYEKHKSKGNSFLWQEINPLCCTRSVWQPNYVGKHDGGTTSFLFS